MPLRCRSVMRPARLVVAFAVLWSFSAARGQSMGDVSQLASRAGQLVQQERWEEAIPLWREVVAQAPNFGGAWFQLGYCLHANRELDEAIEMHLKAAEFPQYRAAALYNTACAYSLKNDADAAFKYLGIAEEARFRNFQLLRTDADLDNIRDDPRYEMWKPFTVEELTVPDAAPVQYSVVLPPGHDPAQSYPLLLAIVDDVRRPDAITREQTAYWGRFGARRGWIVIAAAGGVGGWRSVRAEAQIDALLSHLRETYRVQDDRIDLAGVGAACPDVMHIALDRPHDFRSVTVALGGPEGRFDLGRLARLDGVRLHFIAGEKDATTLASVRGAHAAATASGVDATLSILDDVPDSEDGTPRERATIQLQFGGLMQRIDAHLNGSDRAAHDLSANGTID